MIKHALFSLCLANIIAINCAYPKIQEKKKIVTFNYSVPNELLKASVFVSRCDENNGEIGIILNENWVLTYQTYENYYDYPDNLNPDFKHSYNGGEYCVTPHVRDPVHFRKFKEGNESILVNEHYRLKKYPVALLKLSRPLPKHMFQRLEISDIPERDWSEVIVLNYKSEYKYRKVRSSQFGYFYDPFDYKTGKLYSSPGKIGKYGYCNAFSEKFYRGNSTFEFCALWKRSHINYHICSGHALIFAKTSLKNLKLLGIQTDRGWLCNTPKWFLKLSSFKSSIYKLISDNDLGPFDRYKHVREIAVEPNSWGYLAPDKYVNATVMIVDDPAAFKTEHNSYWIGVILNENWVLDTFSYNPKVLKRRTIRWSVTYVIPHLRISRPDYMWNIPRERILVKEVYAHKKCIPDGSVLLDSPYCFRLLKLEKPISKRTITKVKLSGFPFRDRIDVDVMSYRGIPYLERDDLGITPSHIRPFSWCKKRAKKSKKTGVRFKEISYEKTFCTMPNSIPKKHAASYALSSLVFSNSSWNGLNLLGIQSFCEGHCNTTRWFSKLSYFSDPIDKLISKNEFGPFVKLTYGELCKIDYNCF